MQRSRLLLPLLGTAAALAACSPDSPSVTAPATGSRATLTSSNGRYIVMSNGGSFASSFSSGIAALGGRVEGMHNGAGIAVVSGLSDAAAAKVARLAGVSDIEPDVTVALDAPTPAVVDAAAVSDPVASSPGNPAASVGYSRGYQWNMTLIGAPQAWTAGKLGSRDVKVAIIDSGIDYDAYDLAALIDRTHSVSFVNDDDAAAQFIAAGGTARDAISDYNGHGTNVATQVSSRALLFAGVTSQTTLMAVKVLGASGSGTFGALLQGMLFAADQGADVANMSVGLPVLIAKAKEGRLTSYLNRVFNYANGKGMLVVVAAGNSAFDLDHDGNGTSVFCNMTHVVCVSAVGPASPTDNFDTPASFTDFGRSAVSVAAPGGNLVLNSAGQITFASFVSSSCSKTYLNTLVPTLPKFPCASGLSIMQMAGTSQAAPHVAGLAALLVAEKGHGHPAQIKAAIEQSADDLGQPGTDPYYGKGRIDVAKALGL